MEENSNSWIFSILEVFDFQEAAFMSNVELFKWQFWMVGEFGLFSSAPFLYILVQKTD